MSASGQARGLGGELALGGVGLAQDRAEKGRMRSVEPGASELAWSIGSWVMTVQSGRIPILGVTPLVECGRWPIKAVVDETFTVSATVFREGHDAVNANVVLRGPRGRKGPWTPMHQTVPGTDRWEAEVTPTVEGDWTYVVEAWGDPIASWRHDAEIKVHAGIDVELMLEEGARLLERAAE